MFQFVLRENRFHTPLFAHSSQSCMLVSIDRKEFMSNNFAAFEMARWKTTQGRFNRRQNFKECYKQRMMWTVEKQNKFIESLLNQIEFNFYLRKGKASRLCHVLVCWTTSYSFSFIMSCYQIWVLTYQIINKFVRCRICWLNLKHEIYETLYEAKHINRSLLW